MLIMVFRTWLNILYFFIAASLMTLQLAPTRFDRRNGRRATVSQVYFVVIWVVFLV